jgi:ABC-type multidrug transport system permease subunit
MNRWHQFMQLFLSRLRGFYREPVALFWVYGFPLILALGLGIAFLNRKPEPIVVDIQVEGSSNPSNSIASEADELRRALESPEVKVAAHSQENCKRQLEIGQTAVYIVPGATQYEYVDDETRTEGREARFQVDSIIQRWKAGDRHWPTSNQLITERGSRYIDFLIPGLIGANLMGGGLWGVGFVLVDMRIRKLLKRLLATPMYRSDFLWSVLSARMVIAAPEMVLLLIFGAFVFGVPIRGSLVTLTIVILVGACSFSGLGLLVACRAEKTETVTGLMNLVMLPMWVMSGVFFSSKRFPDVMQPFIQALPLTQLNDALREIMLEGKSLGFVAWRIGIMAVWGIVTFVLALKWFRWQ